MPIISTRFIAIHIKINVLFNRQVSLLRQHWHRSTAEILVHFGKMDNALCSNWIYLECKTALTFFNVQNVRNILYCSFFSWLLRSALYKTRLKEIYLRFVVDGAKLCIVYQHVAVATEMNSFVSQVTQSDNETKLCKQAFLSIYKRVETTKKGINRLYICYLWHQEPFEKKGKMKVLAGLLLFVAFTASYKIPDEQEREKRFIFGVSSFYFKKHHCLFFKNSFCWSKGYLGFSC